MKLLLTCTSMLLTLVIHLEARPQEALQKCKMGPIDLVFIIDSSRSVRPFEFETMRKFMIDIIHTLDVGANATRVGVVQYSSQVQNVFSLRSFTRKADMVKAINEIIPLAQGTMTGLAIQYAMNVAFSGQEGARRGVPSVAVIVTDGRPQDRVAEVAQQAREKGIEIYAVGVARADMSSLRAMASPEFEEHVFLVESFDLIHQFGLQFKDKLCGLDMCTEMDHGCQHVCVSETRSYHCECHAGYTLNADGKTCSGGALSELQTRIYFKYTKTRGVWEMTDHSFSLPVAINLCAQGNHNCEHICDNSLGSYTCRCRAGYYLNQDKHTCTNETQCHTSVLLLVASEFESINMLLFCLLLNIGNNRCIIVHCNHNERNVVLNGYLCRCNDGFTIQDDGKTCKSDDMCNSVEHGCEFRCVSTPGSYYCVCPEGQLLQQDGKSCSSCAKTGQALKTHHVPCPPLPPACRTAIIDLVLVIDGSKSVRPQNFELVKQFVNQVVDTLDVSANGTRVGLVQYSSRVRTEFTLNQYHSADAIKAAVLKVDYMEKGTMTGLALKHLVENSFSEAEGARPPARHIPRVGLVFTDGRSQDDISEWAKKAKEADITMYAVGVGKAVEEELQEIASDPVDKHFFYSADFTAINQIAENLKLNICAEESLGEIEVKDPCACETLVEFQQSTMSTLEQLTQKHILFH
ncbi:MATN4 protein, partial [Amia calva]|nr:MATN4 protein [Amia calva]